MHRPFTQLHESLKLLALLCILCCYCWLGCSNSNSNGGAAASPMPGGLPAVIDAQDRYLVNYQEKQLVIQKGLDELNAYAIINAEKDNVYALSAWLTVMDAATYRDTVRKYSQFNPYDAQSHGYAEAARHFIRIPVVALDVPTATFIHQFLTDTVHSPKLRIFRITGQRGTALQFTENSLVIAIPSGPENNPLLISKMEEFP